MGSEWLNEIIGILENAGIPAGEAYPGGNWAELTEPAALVCLNRMDLGTGIVVFSVRILSPRKLGSQICQDRAVEAMGVLRECGLNCRMGSVGYETGCDCYCVEVLAELLGMLEESWLPVKIHGIWQYCVTEFSAEQDRQRRLIGGTGQEMPIGITPGMGGWAIRMVQECPAGMTVWSEPAEPFELAVEEDGGETVYRNCGWNRIRQVHTPEKTRIEWEGFALEREMV